MKQAVVDPRRTKRCNLAQSFRHAAAGVAYVVRCERNARIHLIIGGTVILLGLLLGLSRLDWAIVLLTIGCVLAGEMLNTAIELVVDMVQPQTHPLAGHAKDVAAGAALAMAIAAAAVGIIIFAPRICARLFS